MAEADNLVSRVTLDLPSLDLAFDFASLESEIQATRLTSTSECRLKSQHNGNYFEECKAAKCTCDAALLLSKQSQDTTEKETYPLTKHRLFKWPWHHLHQEHSNTPPCKFLCKSISSTNTSNVSSMPDLTTCTTNSTPRSLSPWIHDPPSSSLLSLPNAILGQIFGYVLSVPSIIPIGHEFHDPLQLPNRPARTTLRQSLDSPLFLVSHKIRSTALDVFFSKNIFIIDIAAIYDSCASRIDLQIKQLRKFWITETPRMVRYSLQKISRLILRIPVPSTEAAVRRGREEREWMDGSDGHGGGGYRMKSLREEIEDSMVIRKCLQSIMKMTLAVLCDDKGSTIRSSSISGRPRRSKGLKLRRYHSERSASARKDIGTTIDCRHGGPRKPLRLLEIILVKRSSQAMVLQEVLSLVHVLNNIPVRGILRICFELDGRKTFWATKRREIWDDRISNMEPDGAKLLHDLQHLRTWRRQDIEPITSPLEFKYVSLSKEGMLFISPTALRHSDLEMESPRQMPSSRPRAEGQGRDIHDQRTDSFAFIMAQGISLLGSDPTPQEDTFMRH